MLALFPKISIVTPSFNQGKYIEETIQSVLNQNYPNLEYIIIDGGSTDETIEIIKKYENELTYWISEKDNGQTDAINKGFTKCSGDIFNWINSDDYYEPGALLKIGNLFKQDSSINVVCGKEWGFNDNNPRERNLHKGSIIEENVFETIKTGIIDQPCTFFRKRVIENFFPLEISLRYVMDRQLWWQYLLSYGQGGILQVNDIFTNFRLHPQSKTVSDPYLVEKEFDRLKLSLFEVLNAPDVLKKQLERQNGLPSAHWQIQIKPKNFILAAFATFYAKRNYVNDKLDDAAMLMQLVKKWKRHQLNRNEIKLWFISNMIPRKLLVQLKKIKQIISCL